MNIIKSTFWGQNSRGGDHEGGEGGGASQLIESGGDPPQTPSRRKPDSFYVQKNIFSV